MCSFVFVLEVPDRWAAKRGGMKVVDRFHLGKNYAVLVHIFLIVGCGRTECFPDKLLVTEL